VVLPVRLVVQVPVGLLGLLGLLVLQAALELLVVQVLVVLLEAQALLVQTETLVAHLFNTNLKTQLLKKILQTAG
tara:strand:+ start:1325 stop:1549 length:225 start_codon:yes stop_codon:yes gene_type:complete